MARRKQTPLRGNNRASTSAAGRAAPRAAPRPRKPHRWRPGTKALQEIRHYQKTCDLLIPRLPFARYVSPQPFPSPHWCLQLRTVVQCFCGIVVTLFCVRGPLRFSGIQGLCTRSSIGVVNQCEGRHTKKGGRWCPFTSPEPISLHHGALKEVSRCSSMRRGFERLLLE